MVMIRRLAVGELISEPGLYDIPLTRHHGQPCIGPSVTSSVLRRMEHYTPAEVWAYSPLNPERYPRKETDALRMGRAMAAYVEGGPGKVLELFYVLPEDRPNRPTALQRRAHAENRASDAALRSIAFWDAVERDPRDVVTQDEWDLIMAMGEVLSADPAASAVMAGHPEITIAWEDEATGIWVLSRPDTLKLDGTVTDYKKMAAQGRPFTGFHVDRQIEVHGYDQQLALACEGLERLTGHWPTAAGIVAQSDEPPYSVIIRPVEEEDLRIGQFLNREALRRFRECLDAGHWPGPGDDIAAFQRRKDSRERLLERMNTAGVAP